jgi:MFS transporter, DHA1 family, inner membrane transport protein
MSPREWLLLLVLSAIQFTHVLDFVLLMPLEPYFGYTPQHFALVVSVYGLGAGLSGLLLAPLLDRVDRKIVTLLLYAGFALSTVLCGLAPSYGWLLVARSAAGAFGGVVASCVLAIIADAFPSSRRGTAMGMVMSAFSIASIVGIPLGLALAEYSGYGWRAPFIAVGGLSVVVLIVAAYALPSIRGHLDHRRGDAPKLLEVFTHPRHLVAYSLMIVMVLSSFVLVPYLAAYSVRNIGISKKLLPVIYIAGGIATLISMNLIGRLADRINRLTLFRIMTLSAAIPVLTLLVLPHGTPLLWLVTTTTCFMICTSGRMVPAMALITGAATRQVRGSFLSINSSLQQFAIALAPLIGAQFLGETDGNTQLEGFHWLGFGMVSGLVVSVIIAGFLRPAPGESAVSVPTLELEAGVAVEVSDCPPGEDSPDKTGIVPIPAVEGVSRRCRPGEQCA